VSIALNWVRTFSPSFFNELSVSGSRERGWIVDLPFGRGKWLGRDAGDVLNRIIGGWQLAGSGTVRSNYFALPTSIYPNGNPTRALC